MSSHVPLPHRPSTAVGLFEESGSVRGQCTIEDAPVMASPVTIGHIGLAGDSTGVFSNETGAGGSIHMAGEVVFLGDGWAGELIPLQLLLVNRIDSYISRTEDFQKKLLTYRNSIYLVSLHMF